MAAKVRGMISERGLHGRTLMCTGRSSVSLLEYPRTSLFLAVSVLADPGSGDSLEPGPYLLGGAGDGGLRDPAMLLIPEEGCFLFPMGMLLVRESFGGGAICGVRRSSTGPPL